MRRIIILLPVSPSRRMIVEDIANTRKVMRQITNIIPTSVNTKVVSFASCISTIPFVIAPGPQIMGIARGVTEISVTYCFSLSSPIFVRIRRAWSISYPIIKKITPPTIRKLATEIPKKLNRMSPEKANRISVIKAVTTAFAAVCLRAWGVRSAVMVINTGIIAKGFMSVKKEVKAKSPKAKSSFCISMSD